MKPTTTPNPQAEIDEIDATLARLNDEVNDLMKRRRDLPAVRHYLRGAVDLAAEQNDADHLAALVAIAAGDSPPCLSASVQIDTPKGPVLATVDLGPLLVRLLGKSAVLEALQTPLADAAVRESCRHDPRADSIEREGDQLQRRRDELCPDEAVKMPTAEDFQNYEAAQRPRRQQ